MIEHQLSKRQRRTKVLQESPQISNQEAQSGFDPRLMSPAPVLHLQRTIGNAAVQRLVAKADQRPVSQPHSGSFVGSILRRKPPQAVASTDVVQRALWTNSAAKFLTDNGNPDIPNSEYKVSGNGYMRYAPINKTRALEQVFHEGERSFAYIDAADDIETNRKYDAVWEKPIFVSSVSSDEVKFKTGNPKFKKSPEVVGKITPSEGARVFDFQVDDSTRQLNRDSHVGHAVEDLGEALPTLDDPDALKAARDYQHYLIEQYLMLKKKGLVTSFEDWNDKSLGNKPI